MQISVNNALLGVESPEHHMNTGMCVLDISTPFEGRSRGLISSCGVIGSQVRSMAECAAKTVRSI